jgi:hypothetical protein
MLPAEPNAALVPVIQAGTRNSSTGPFRRDGRPYGVVVGGESAARRACSSYGLRA